MMFMFVQVFAGQDWGLMEKGAQRSLARVLSRRESFITGQENQEHVGNVHSDLSKRSGEKEMNITGKQNKGSFSLH